MLAALCAIGSAITLLLGGRGGPRTGYLVEAAPPAAARLLRYAPREGDLVFYDDKSRVWTALFALAGTGPPLHMGIVVKKPDGTLAVLEAGPDDSLWVKLLDLPGRLHQFDRDFRNGTITVRRCKKTLDPDQSAALTRFALAQKGKRYAALRLLLQGTSWRARDRRQGQGGKTYLDRSAWICSELAVAAAAVAGLLDPTAVKANATYPRDLVDNQRHDLGAAWHDAARWQPTRHPFAHRRHLYLGRHP
jgi:hypothetical protein